MPTATTPAHPDRAFNYLRVVPGPQQAAGSSPVRRRGARAARRLCPIPTSSPTAPGTAALPTWAGRNRRAAAAGPTEHILQPSNTQANPANERGWAFMWHSHNEREITTNNVFPGGMLMMMLVDSREFVIDETN